MSPLEVAAGSPGDLSRSPGDLSSSRSPGDLSSRSPGNLSRSPGDLSSRSPGDLSRSPGDLSRSARGDPSTTDATQGQGTFLLQGGVRRGSGGGQEGGRAHFFQEEDL
eukprot:1184252-Prorocentrum_minimum.AAC.4